MPPRVLRISSVFEVPQATLDVSGAACDPVGGMQTHAAELTRTLDGRGVVQDVITARRPGAPSRERLGERAALYRVGLPVRPMRQLYSLPATPLALALAREADLVHAHLGEDVAVLPIAALAARMRGLPLVVTVHTSPRHTLRVVDARTAFVHGVGGTCETRVLPRAAAVVTLTRRLATLAAEHGVRPDRITVVPSGVATRLLAPARAERPPDPFPGIGHPRVLFLGRLAKQKGVETLVRAVPRLPPGAHVLVVGDGPERRVLEREAAGLGVSGHVHFAGLVAREVVPAVFAHADVLALPSRYEELGSVMLEAMWMGLPVVGTSTGGIPEVVRDGRNGYLVEPGDSDALGDRLARILTDDALRARLSREARSVAGGFEWDRLAGRILELYERVLAEAAAAEDAARPARYRPGRVRPRTR